MSQRTGDGEMTTSGVPGRNGFQAVAQEVQSLLGLANAMSPHVGHVPKAEFMNMSANYRTSWYRPDLAEEPHPYNGFPVHTVHPAN